jgi:hypothetical protein
MHLIDSRKEADGTETVTAILEVWSVDAVTRPATTRTLFEQEGGAMPEDVMPPPAANPGMSVEEAFMALQNAVMASDEYEDGDRLAVLKDIMKLKAKVLGGPEEEAEPPAEGEAPAEESHARPVIGRTARELQEIRSTLRALTIRQMAGESMPLDGDTMKVLLGLPDDAAVAGYLDSLRRARRPRYSAGAPRSAGRVVGEAQARPAAIPRLTAGADRDAVKRFYQR